jgi:hypothetical protein
MFIIAYAKYLGIPMRTINEHLPDRGESASEGYQYISTSTENLPSLRHDIASKPAGRNTLLYVLATITLTVVLLAVGGGGYYLIVNAQRLTTSVDKPAPTPTPEPPAPQIIFHETVLANVTLDGAVPDAFVEKVEWTAPPAAESGVVNVRKPTPTLSATVAPAPGAGPTPESVITEDQAFLLGASPNIKPANVR